MKFPGAKPKPRTIAKPVEYREQGIVSQADIARIADVSNATAHTWVKDGRFPVDAQGRIRRVDVLKFFPKAADEALARALKEALEACGEWKTVQLVAQYLSPDGLDPRKGDQVWRNNFGKPNPDAKPDAVTTRGPIKAED